MRRGAALIDLEPKVFQMLVLLMNKHGDVVSYQEFKEAIWPDVNIEIAQNINVLANKLRDALGESGRNSVYILTKRGQGYQFNPEVPVVTASPAVAPRRSNAVRMALAGAAVAAVLLGGLSAWRSYTGPLLEDYRIEGHFLVAIDSKGSELWRYRIDELKPDMYSSQYRAKVSWIGDLDGDGGRDLVFMTSRRNRDEVGDELYCFRSDGKVRWRFRPGRAVVDRSGDRMVPPFWPVTFEVVKGRTRSETRVAVSSVHYINQPCQIALLDPDGHVIAEYWHPGHLNRSGQADLDGDGLNELLFAGVNNGEHQATLVVLDPRTMSGITTPAGTKDPRFEFVGMSKAAEKAVVLLPRACLSLGHAFSVVGELRVTADRILALESESEKEQDLGYLFEFDYGLRLISVVPNAPMVQVRHDELQRQGIVKHTGSVLADLQQLKDGVVVSRPR